LDRLIENTDCYVKSEQRELLFRLFEHEAIDDSFFLTGGTALSVFYLHHRTSIDIDSIYKDARQKEGMFDDPPMVSYQMENNLKMIKQNRYAFPGILVDFNIDEFYRFYEELIYKTYHRQEE
jgi:hypothetical protein